MPVKKPSKKDAELARLRKELLQLRSGSLFAFADAARNIPDLNRNKYLASGVIVTITNLSGDVKVGPVMIKDGLSNATIAALSEDVRRSYNDHVEHPVNQLPKKGA